MGKYKTLFKNSTILGAGAFLSKALVFVLLPLYSSVLSTAEYGVADLVAQSSNLLFPIVTVGICQAVFRFSYDDRKNLPRVFSTGIVTFFIGMTVFAVICPFLSFIGSMYDYILLLWLYVFMFALNTLCGSFLRGIGAISQFAVKGVICTVATIVFNLLFLLVFKLGVVGYLLANICADFCAVMYMFWSCDLLNFINLKSVKRTVWLDMLKFSVFLVPTTICWWVVNISDRYFINYMISEEANGIYSMSSKIPNLMIVVTGIFTDAWQMSLATEETRGAKWGGFFTRIFDGFKCVMFVGASALILLVKPITKALMLKDFFEAWRYMPYLIIACVFTGIVSFIGVIYIIKKKSRFSLICAVSGAGLNIILNFILISISGAMGAAVATMVSYFAVYFITTYLSRGLIKYKPHLPALAVNTALLLLQAILTVHEVPYIYIYSSVIFIAITAINFRGVYRTANELLAKRRGAAEKKKEETE